MYAQLWGRESVCVLPGCVWSGPRPEELKALNVIIRAVGEPSSNHTQITYTLTPTYNTSHPRAVCMRVCVWLKGRKGGVDWEVETKWKTRSICASRSCASCCHKASVCSQACANAARGAWAKAVDVCVAEEKRRVLFSSSFSSSLSSFYLSVPQYIPPLYFPFLHAAPDVKAVKY